MFLKEKPKGTKYERYERHNIVCKILKAKMQYCIFEVTDAVLESKIFKIGDIFSAAYHWYYLVLNYFSKYLFNI